jgi:hypothetical protein
MLMLLVTCMAGACSSTTQSQEASTPEAQESQSLAETVLNPEAPVTPIKGPSVPCEKNFDKETCESFRGVKTKGP